MKIQLTYLAIFLLLLGCITAPPKIFEMNYAELLIRHELSHADSYMGSNRTFSYFVSVHGKDPPRDELARLSDTGTHFYPGTSWRGTDHYSMQLSISAPIALPDGTFRVSHDYYCGERCASSNVALMRHDKAGWHFVSSVLESISRREMPTNPFKPKPLRGSV